MEYLEAVITVLKNEGKPLNIREIVDRAVKENLIEGGREDLVETIDSLILKDLKTKGIRSIFSRIGPGTYFVKDLNNREKKSGASFRKREKTVRSKFQAVRLEKREEKSDVKDVKLEENKVNEKDSGEKKEEVSFLGDKRFERIYSSIESVGKFMEYKVKREDENVIMWLKDENPEIVFIVNPEFSSTLMGKIVDFRNLNFRKVVLILENKDIESSGAIFPNEDIKTWCEIWSKDLIVEMGSSCEKFMTLFRKLTDFRDISKKGVYIFK